ncbi:MAG: CPBP family intramembrane metalloprotease [Acidobacteriota bacterium]|nr:CPBP family intramembrane metalloprotease [Acidobacteriota bacterium]
MTAEPADEQRPRPPYWLALAAVLAGFAAGLFATVMVALIGTAFGSSVAHPTPAVNIVSDYAFDAGFVGSALYFTVIGRWMGRREFGYNHIPWRRGAAALVLAAIAYYVVTLGYSAIFNLNGTDRLPAGLGVKTSVWAAAFTALFVCAVAPMAEEFFFRGFLFGVLARMRVRVAGHELGPWLAAAFVGLLFGLAHYDSAQPEFLIPLGFLGFVLCIVRWRTGSLYPCMALHAINNCIALGVNELGWNGGEIVALTLGALAVIALVTAPLARGSARVSPM